MVAVKHDCRVLSIDDGCDHRFLHECKNCKYNELQIDNDGFCSGECYWSYQFSKRVNNKKERERRYQQIAQTEKLHY